MLKVQKAHIQTNTMLSTMSTNMRVLRTKAAAPTSQIQQLINKNRNISEATSEPDLIRISENKGIKMTVLHCDIFEKLILDRFLNFS